MPDLDKGVAVAPFSLPEAPCPHNDSVSEHTGSPRRFARSATATSSLNYFARLPPAYHSDVRASVAGVWLQIEVAGGALRGLRRPRPPPLGDHGDRQDCHPLRAQRPRTKPCALRLVSEAGVTPWTCFGIQQRLWTQSLVGRRDVATFKLRSRRRARVRDRRVAPAHAFSYCRIAMQGRCSSAKRSSFAPRPMRTDPLPVRQDDARIPHRLGLTRSLRRTDANRPGVLQFKALVSFAASEDPFPALPICGRGHLGGARSLATPAQSGPPLRRRTSGEFPLAAPELDDLPAAERLAVFEPGPGPRPSRRARRARAGRAALRRLPSVPREGRRRKAPRGRSDPRPSAQCSAPGSRCRWHRGRSSDAAPHPAAHEKPHLEGLRKV